VYSYFLLLNIKGCFQPFRIRLVPYSHWVFAQISGIRKTVLFEASCVHRTFFLW